jgi:hypothetical protein
MDVDIVLDSPRIGHEIPDLSSLEARDNNGLDAFENAARSQEHDMPHSVSGAGAVSSHTAPDANRVSADPPSGIGLQSQIKDENGQLGGNVGVHERATTAHAEFDAGDAARASSTSQPVWVRPQPQT